MKQLFFSLSLLLIGTFTLAQTAVSPPTVQISPGGQTPPFTHEVINLPTYGAPHFYTYLWWFGEGNYSFVDAPIHEYYILNSASSTVAEGASFVTGNYGSGGPPPMAFRGKTPTDASMPNTLSGGSQRIRIQHFNNIVPRDTVYFIITYANYDADRMDADDILLEFGDPDIASTLEYIPDASWNNIATLPFGETEKPQTIPSEMVWTYPTMRLNDERSFLAAFRVMDAAADYVDMELPVNVTFKRRSINSNSVDHLNVAVRASRDPNDMTPSIGAANDCDMGGKTIRYKVRFQNTGSMQTNYVRLEVLLDPNLDLNSIRNFDFHTPVNLTYPNLIYDINTNTLGTNLPNLGMQTGWCNYLDAANRKLYIEFQNLHLLPLGSPLTKDIEQTRGWVEFDVTVNGGYSMSNDIVCKTDIFFDINAPVSTNEAVTTCEQSNGGGGTVKPSNGDPIWLNCCFWAIVFGLLSLLLLLLWLMERGKRKRLSKSK